MQADILYTPICLHVLETPKAYFTYEKEPKQRVRMDQGGIIQTNILESKAIQLSIFTEKKSLTVIFREKNYEKGNTVKNLQ